MKKFVAAKQTLSTLLSDYPQISAKGGDEIRRYLGIVGTTSPLFSINKTFADLRDSADDIVEFTEAATDFDRALRGADGQAYSSNFVEFSASKGTKEDYYASAKVDIVEMDKFMKVMAKELGV